MKLLIENEIAEHLKVAETMSSLTNKVEIAAQLCIDTLQGGGKILIFGNGGSAADAQHIAAELVGRYKMDRKGIPAIALTTDTSTITAISNDFGYEYVFDFIDNIDINDYVFEEKGCNKLPFVRKLKELIAVSFT